MAQMEGKSPQQQLNISCKFKTAFDDLLKKVKITKPYLDFDRYGNDAELSLGNPYSVICCFVLMVYSMEIGNPPLYAEANRVAREMDFQYLETLGPFQQVLRGVTNGLAEDKRHAEDKIKTGE